MSSVLEKCCGDTKESEREKDRLTVGTSHSLHDTGDLCLQLDLVTLIDR